MWMASSLSCCNRKQQNAESAAIHVYAYCVGMIKFLLSSGSSSLMFQSFASQSFRTGYAPVMYWWLWLRNIYFEKNTCSNSESIFSRRSRSTLRAASTLASGLRKWRAKPKPKSPLLESGQPRKDRAHTPLQAALQWILCPALRPVAFQPAELKRYVSGPQRQSGTTINS